MVFRLPVQWGVPDSAGRYVPPQDAGTNQGTTAIRNRVTLESSSHESSHGRGEEDSNNFLRSYHKLIITSHPEHDFEGVRSRNQTNIFVALVLKTAIVLVMLSYSPIVSHVTSSTAL